MKMWLWWWWRENNRNVVVAAVVEEHNRKEVVVGEKYWILLPSKLYQCALCYHFLSLHSAPEELTWVGSVPFAKKDSMQRHVMSKHHNVGLTPFQTVPFSQKCQRFRFEHPFTSMIAGITGSGKTAWVRFLLQQASETIYPPRRGLFGVIHNGSLRIHKC